MILTTLQEQGLHPDVIDDTYPDDIYLGYFKYNSKTDPEHCLIKRIKKETIEDRVITRILFPFGRFDFVFDWNERLTITDWRYRDFPAVDAGGDVQGLLLTWGDIDSVPVENPGSVSEWNTFFDLPANGTAFSSVAVDGNTVSLFGGANITIKAGLFSEGIYPILDPHELGGALISIVDNANCINHIEEYGFGFNYLIQSSLETVILPALISAAEGAFCSNRSMINFTAPQLTYAGLYCFYGCSSLTSLDLPNLETAEGYAFEDTSGITDYYFPALITAGEGCFSNNYSDTCKTINLPSCISVGDACFVGNQAVESIFLPVVENLGNSATSGSYSDIFENPAYDVTDGLYVPTIPIVLCGTNGVFNYLGRSNDDDPQLTLTINADLLTINEDQYPENDIADLLNQCELTRLSEGNTMPRVHYGSKLTIIPV